MGLGVKGFKYAKIGQFIKATNNYFSNVGFPERASIYFKVNMVDFKISWKESISNKNPDRKFRKNYFLILHDL